MRGLIMQRPLRESIKAPGGFDFEPYNTPKCVDYGKFYIRGIIDGINRSQKIILEIKTRQNFEKDANTIKNSERCKILAYMNMFECTQCLFVESGPNGERKETMIPYNDELFRSDVLDKLERMVDKARSYSRDQFKDLLIKYSID